MYRLFFTDRKRKTTNVLTFTSEDMKLAELSWNVLRDTYNLPEFTELQDGSFIAQNAQFKIILAETTVEPTNTIENGNTHF